MAGHRTISVATFNIHHGADELGAPAIEAQAALLRGICADAVALQECDVGVPRSGHIDQVALLASLAGYPYHAFGANVRLDGGEYGCAILSRLPLSGVLNTPVPQSDDGAPRLHIDGRTHHRERRGILEALVATDCGPVALIVAHASIWPDERVCGSEAILALLARRAGPAVVAGDFNVEDHDAPEIAMLRAVLSDAHEDAGEAWATYPSSAPAHRIDRIMSRGLTTLAAQTVPTGASDHSALRASFALPER
jgi:endonuclease/exonuclease/phosphatase family metal-dependent hydrolase